MKEWVVYALIASIAYGISAIPIKIAVSRSAAQGLSEAVLLITCLSSLIGAGIYVFVSGGFPNLLSAVDKTVVMYSGLAGVISIIGSLAVIRALGFQSSSVPNVMALVNTNVFFTILFSAVILGGLDAGTLVKTIMGSVLIFAGAAVICG